MNTFLKSLIFVIGMIVMGFGFAYFVEDYPVPSISVLIVIMIVSLIIELRNNPERD